jgi:hypothetical protein
MHQYELFETALNGTAPYDNEAQPDCTADFTCGSHTIHVKGFWNGQGQYVFRYLPEETGIVTWQIHGCVSGSGQEEILPARPGHHGRVIAEDTHFRYEDGTAYSPFGTTVYALMHQPDERVEQTLSTLSDAPFNKVRLCLFPKWYDYNHREPVLFPFQRKADGTSDVRHPLPAFWNRFEKIMDKLEDLGIQTDLILFHPYDKKEWGFSSMSTEDCLIYLDYVIRRFAAKPSLWWSLANEYDLMLHRSQQDWETFETYVSREDPFHHLLSIHACMRQYDYSRPDLTHVCLQSQDTARTDAYIQKYKKPVIFDEMCYEGNLPANWGNLSAFEMVNRFWCVMAKGGYGTHGEVFLADDDILWWAAGGILKGKSAPRIAWLREIMESLPGPVEADSGNSLPPEVLSNPQLLDVILKDQPEETKLFARNLLSMGEKEREDFLLKNTSYAGHCGEDAYLIYFAHTCPGLHTMKLPKDRTYTIYVLDVWEMEKTVFASHSSGTFNVTLPGKEGIAILAVKE